MADTWITDIAHFLDENGEMITEPQQAAKMGEYFAAIIVMASEVEYPPEHQVLCRRKPKRKPCLGKITGYISPETDEIVWECPKCGDWGAISHWQGTIWDMFDAGAIAH